MERIKPFLESAEKHIRNKDFKKALDDAETALLFMGILFMISLSNKSIFFRDKFSSKLICR